MDIIKCLQKINPNVGWSVNANDYAQITCNDANTSIPILAQLESAWQQILADEQATEYQRLRVKAYPPIPEQLDLIFHGGLETWSAEIQRIKDLYPKPEVI